MSQSTINANSLDEELAQYLSNSHNRRIKVDLRSEQSVEIKSSIFHFNSGIEFLFVCIGAVIIIQYNQVLIAGLFMSATGLIFLLIDIDAANDLDINYSEGALTVISKNFIFWLMFPKRIRIDFEEIQTFSVSGSPHPWNMRRYRVTCILKTGEKIILVDFSDEENANQVAAILKKNILRRR